MGDWVVQNETWLQYSVAPTGLAFLSQVNLAGHRTEPLTTWSAPIATGGLSQDYRLPQGGAMVATQTRGHIHWVIAPTNSSGSWSAIFTQDWGAILHFRIGVVLGSSTDANPVTFGRPANYDLNDANSANDEYVWDRQIMTFNISADEWTGRAAQRARIYGTLPVVAKYKRVLQAPQVMGLHYGFDQTALQTWDSEQGDRLQLFIRPQLRTWVNVMR